MTLCCLVGVKAVRVPDLSLVSRGSVWPTMSCSAALFHSLGGIALEDLDFLVGSRGKTSRQSILPTKQSERIMHDQCVATIYKKLPIVLTVG